MPPTSARLTTLPTGPSGWAEFVAIVKARSAVLGAEQILAVCTRARWAASLPTPRAHRHGSRRASSEPRGSLRVAGSVDPSCSRRAADRRRHARLAMNGDPPPRQVGSMTVFHTSAGGASMSMESVTRLIVRPGARGAPTRPARVRPQRRTNAVARRAAPPRDRRGHQIASQPLHQRQHQLRVLAAIAAARRAVRPVRFTFSVTVGRSTSISSAMLLSI